MSITLITKKNITTEEDRINLMLNCEKLNFASMGIYLVDRDHPMYYEFIESALGFAKTFGDKAEIEKLSKILENKSQ